MNDVFYRKCASSFDGFIELTILKEGLISSYDVKKLQKRLQIIFTNRIKIDNPQENELLDTKLDWNAYSFVLAIHNYNKKDEEQLLKILNVFGYYISQSTQHTDYSRFTIEPRHAIKINDILKEKDVYYLYHITHNSNLNSIKKIGLAPKGSETRFDHPGDRIYLIMANPQQLWKFKYILARDKKKPIEEFTTFKIPFNDKYNYYLDDTATLKSQGVIACFVLQNIPPEELTIL